jgi:hypothetical protein
MTSLLTFNTLDRAREMAQAFITDNPGGSYTITQLHDGRFRLDLVDPPADRPVA